MQALRPLRDRTGTTRVLILAALESRPAATLSEIAEELDVTVQAISAHAQEMARQGWVTVEDGAYQPTAKGRQWLHEGVRQLRDAVTTLAAPLDVIQVASAVAGSTIAAGAEVGLFMVDGELEARPGASASSRGRASTGAKAGDELIVTDLKGMVKLEPGTSTVVSLPGPAEGGIARADLVKLRKTVAAQKAGKVGAHGTGAVILARRLVGDGLRSLDFTFAADRAAFNAAERGLDVLLLVTRDRLSEVMLAFERLNAATLRRVPITLLEAPERNA